MRRILLGRRPGTAGGSGGGTPDDNSVSTAKIQDGAVTAAKVAADVATQAELDEVASEAGGLFDAYALLRDEKAANTPGGGAAAGVGAFATRDLNTEVFDPDGIVSLSSNQFTLQAGTYFIRARAPSFGLANSRAKIRNVTDGTDALLGSSTYDGALVVVDSLVQGRVTIAAAKVFALQYRVDVSSTTNDLGRANNFGIAEIYSEVEIWREAA